MLLFAPHHSAEFARVVAANLGCTLSPSEEREFEDGEHKMRPLIDVLDRDVCVVQSLSGDAQASANDKLCRLLFFIGALKDAGARRVIAAIPYLAYSRKDRRTQPNDPVTTRYVATMFEAMGVDCVVVLDVHNEAAFDNAFRCRTIRLEAADAFAAALAPSTGGYPIVVASPDIGGVKRAQRFRDALIRRLGQEVGFAFVEKRRAAEVVSGDALVGRIDGAEVVFYDDLIASGATLHKAAKAARRAGAARVRIAAPHAAFTLSALQLLQGGTIDDALVGDSIRLTPPFAAMLGQRLSVCSLAPLFAETLRALTRQ